MTKIVAGGRDMGLTPRVLEAEDRVREEVLERWAPEIERAGFLRRIVLRWRRGRDLRRALAKVRPSDDALFLGAR